MIIVLLWVSGSGKTTVMTHLLQEFPQLQLIRSYVTRPMRLWEINGERYNFVTQEVFETMTNNNEFIEYAYVHGGGYYGTHRHSVQSSIDMWYTPIKEVDIIWLDIIKKDLYYGNKTISIFLNIDDNTIIQRITQRAPLDEEEINRRIHSAQHEREKATQLCNYIIDASRPLEIVLQDILLLIRWLLHA